MEAPNPGFLGPDGLFWVWTFTVGVFAAAVVHLWSAFREAKRRSEKSRPWIDGVWQLVIFSLIVGGFYLLESWADHRTPYFLYPNGFPLMLEPHKFDCCEPERTGILGVCAKFVEDTETKAGSGIPLAIIVMEATLFCSVMWIGRFFNISLWALPFFAALVLVNIDVLLDPVVTSTYKCDGNPSVGGLGLWQWFGDPNSKVRGEWFGVPLFNYATWWGGPLALAALALLVGWAKDGLKRLSALGTVALHRHVPSSPLLGQSTVERWERDWRCHNRFLIEGRKATIPSWLEKPLWVLALLCGAGAILWYSPNFATEDPTPQRLAMGFVLLCSAAYFVRRAFDFSTSAVIDWRLAAPQLFAVAFPVTLLIGAGLLGKNWLLVMLSVTTLLFGTLLCWGTKQEAVHRFTESVQRLDRLLRIHYYALTALMMLLAARTVSDNLTGVQIRQLLGVAACFHVFGYLLNDWMDQAEDRQTPTRKGRPLLAGQVSPSLAIFLVILTVPAAVSITFHANGGMAEWVTLVCAFGLIFVYDVWGKKLPTPHLADAIKSAAWGCLWLLAVYLMSEGPVVGLSRILVLYGVGFVFLMNVVRRHGQEKYAVAIVIVFLLGSSLLWGPFASKYECLTRSVIAVGLVILLVWSIVNLRRIPGPDKVKAELPRHPLRSIPAKDMVEAGLTRHLLPLLVAPLWVFADYLGPHLLTVALMVLLLPMLAQAEVVSIVLGPYAVKYPKQPVPGP